MSEKKYLIYLDILGFEKLAEEIANKSGFAEDWIRQTCLSNPLKDKIAEIKNNEIEVSQGISEIEGSDNYILIVDNIQKAFEVVGKLTKIKIHHKDKNYEFIPLEVALGVKEIDLDVKVENKNRKEIIKFLKDNIINPYRKYYKKKHGKKEKEVKETFILFTQEFFDSLELLDKKNCEKVPYKNGNFFVANVNKIQQRGRVFDFLEKIGYVGNKWYGRINEIYVPPLEYEEMEHTLEEKRFLFITGTPEYGKTYTAVKLMWEYYNRGYKPKWIKGRELTERVKGRGRLENINAELKSQHIIYFEDPFGITKYEENKDLETEIGRVINSIKQVEDVYVIITSREEVFKEFEEEKISVNDLKEFEKKLNIKNPSYDLEKKEAILLRWAEEENCRWLKNKNLKELVLESIKNENILPTPLSIRNFAIDTIEVEKEEELKTKIKEKSKETAKAFAKEIKSMTYDKILFLSFPFILNQFGVEFIKETYQELVRELNLETTWEFDRILAWFKDDKINIIDKTYLEFSHPSYSEAFEYVLVEDGYITDINRNIFSKLLLKLSGKREVTDVIIWFVGNNYNRLTEDVKELLLKLSKEDISAWIAGYTLYHNIDKFPESVKRELLIELSKKNDATGHVALAISHNFNKLPEELRDLLKLDKVQRQLRQIIIGAYSMGEKGKESALDYIFNVRSKLNSDFVLKILNDLSNCEYEEIRMEATELLKTISIDSKNMQ